MRDLSAIVSGVADDAFKPTKVPSRSYGLVLGAAQLWWDVADVATLTLSGDTISQINDKSGNNNHGTAPYGSGNGWLYGGSNLRTINGISVASGNGSNRPITHTSVPASDLTSTRYIVASIDSVLNGNVPLMSCMNEHNLGLHVVNFSGTLKLVSQHVGSNLGTTYANHDAAPVVTGTPYVFAERRNTNSITLSVNGVRETESWAPSGVGSNEAYIWIGHCHNYRNLTQFDGMIGEVLIYDAVHTDAEMLIVENYLMDKWGIDP